MRNNIKSQNQRMSSECEAIYLSYFQLCNSTTTILDLCKWWDRDDVRFLYDFIKKYKAK